MSISSTTVALRDNHKTGIMSISSAELMLMMLALGLSLGAELLLMMLALLLSVGGAALEPTVVEAGRAEAHDADLGVVSWCHGGRADAQDAGLVVVS